jgi:hypothetical protein
LPATNLYTCVRRCPNDSKVAVEPCSYLRGELSWERFIDDFGEPKDDLVGDLVDLIEHEPKKGWFLGLNDKDWATYQAKVNETIHALEA